MAEVPACAHLHVHSEYSLLDGACKIEALAARAAELGQPALGLTDHGVMNGSVELYKACRKHGVKPILGLEAYFADDRRSDERQERNHLTLLAATDAGFRNLIQLTSSGYLEGYRRGKPIVDMELLDRHSDGVIALSGCMQSRFNQRLIQGDRVAARAHADELIQVFGPDNLYFEVQENGIAEQAVCNEGTAAIARELGRPLVGTADVHYLTRDDHDHHATLLCVQTKSTRADPKLTFDTNEFFLKSSEEMASAFARWPEAIPTTLEIAERCQTEMSFGGQLIPSYPTPDGSGEDEYLRRITREGLAARYGDPPPAEAVERLEMELGVIERMGFSAYFLIVWDFVKYAKDSGIAVGPGRGSAAGSIVSYVLRITDVDPLAYGLMFERFLNPERVEMPDIDIDFSVRGRGRVIDYVADKYGRESVAQIVTFGKMLPRNATRDAARVLGKEYAVGDRLAKLIPEPVMGRTKTFEDYLKEEPELRRVYQQEPEATEIIDAARGLEGIVRNAGIHAAAVVIADRPLTELVPLQLAEDKSGGERRFKVVTQYAMGPIAELGLLKMDFLGLRNLDVIQDALAIIERAGGTPPDMESLPLDDPKVYEMLARGDSDGVFQMESTGMRDALRKVRPSEFEDLVALVALYRPGAMAHIDTYARNKRAPDDVQYIDERLRAITERTYSVILYQEQSMQIAREIAGFSGAEADHLRKAIGKKKRDQMAALRERFFEGCRASGTSERVIEQLWAVNEAAADYSFNLAHAACYALIAYRTAWLKANHPVEYMAALISSVMQTKDRVPFYVSRCEEMGIEVLPPDINESGHDFSVGDGRIRFGLDAVKDVGSAAVDRLVEARADGGPFTSLWDFCERVDAGRVNKKAIEALVKCGAFDCTGDTRTGMLAVLAQAQASGQKTQQDAALGQSSIFDLFEAEVPAGGGPATNGHEHPPVPRLPDERGDLNRMEKETLGLFLSNHPVKEVRAALRAAVDCSLAEVAARRDGDWVTVGGIVTESKKIRTRNGSDLMFATLDDLEGSVELLVFAKAIEKCHDALTSDKVLLVRGRVDHKEKGKTTLIVQEVTPFEPSADEVASAAETAGRPPRRVQLVVAPGRPESFLDELREVVGNHPGDDELVLIVGDRRLVLGPEFRVRECPALHVELEQLEARVDAAAA